MKNCEYSAHKAEINQLVSIQHTYIIAMYTITVAIIGIAIQSASVWMYLLPYIILIPFQRIVQAKKYISLKLSAFIAVYGDDIWEKNYGKIEKIIKEQYKNKKLQKFQVMRVSSLHLAILCSGLCIVQNIRNNYGAIQKGFNVSIKEMMALLDNDCIITCVLAIGLMIFQIYWCRNALDSMEKRKQYIDVLVENRIEDTLSVSESAPNISDCGGQCKVMYEIRDKDRGVQTVEAKEVTS